MDPTLVQAFKTAVSASLGLTRDALHVHVGLGILFAVALATRRPLSSGLPLLSVLAVAAVGELFDGYHDVARFGFWRWWASLHDIANTMVWPTGLWGLARSDLLPGLRRPLQTHAERADDG